MTKQGCPRVVSQLEVGILTNEQKTQGKMSTLRKTRILNNRLQNLVAKTSIGVCKDNNFIDSGKCVQCVKSGDQVRNLRNRRLISVHTGDAI